MPRSTRRGPPIPSCARAFELISHQGRTKGVTMPSEEATPTPAIDLGAHAERLRSLHVPGDPLLLPNAWDAATARAVVEAGFPVVATTSGGVAAALGYPDHEEAPADEMLAAAARIARGVDAP